MSLPPCVIMAGGLGKRLGSITKNTPKPIIKIRRHLILFTYLIGWKNSFRKFYIFTSFKKKKINEIIKIIF